MKNPFRVEDGTCYYENGVVVGEVYKEVDGFYVMVFNKTRGGCWEGEVLIKLGEMLMEMNRPWECQINRDLVCSERGHDFTKRAHEAPRMWLCSRCDEPGWEIPLVG